MWQDIHATFYCGTQEVTGHSSIWQQDTLQFFQKAARLQSKSNLASALFYLEFLSH